MDSLATKDMLSMMLLPKYLIVSFSLNRKLPQESSKAFMLLRQNTNINHLIQTVTTRLKNMRMFNVCKPFLVLHLFRTVVVGNFK